MHLNNFPTCDHFPLSFSTSEIAPSDNTKIIHFRNLKSISIEKFCSDVLVDLNNVSDFTKLSFPNKISHFNASCSKILEIHAPLHSKKIREIPSVPGFDTEYREARKVRRKAEKVWKKTKEKSDYKLFDIEKQHCKELIKTKNAKFFQSQLKSTIIHKEVFISLLKHFLTHPPTLFFHLQIQWML